MVSVSSVKVPLRFIQQRQYKWHSCKTDMRQLFKDISKVENINLEFVDIAEIFRIKR